MSEKKSFVIHKDSLAFADEMSDEQLGRVFRAIINHQTGKPYEMDFVTKLVFSPFKAQFDRDEEKYAKTSRERAEAGKKGGLAKASKTKQKLAKRSKAKQNVANLAVSVSDSVSESESESEIHNPPTPLGGGADKPLCVSGQNLTTSDEFVEYEENQATDHPHEHPKSQKQDDSRDDNVVPATTPKGGGKKKPSASYSWPKPDDIDQDIWDQWLAVRKIKKAPITEPSIAAMTREAEKYGITFAEAVKICLDRPNPWAGFRASYMQSENGRRPHDEICKRALGEAEMEYWQLSSEGKQRRIDAAVAKVQQSGIEDYF